jgi:hypothetical protein
MECRAIRDHLARGSLGEFGSRAAVPLLALASAPERMGPRGRGGLAQATTDYELGGGSVARFSPVGFVVGPILTRPAEDRERSRWLDLQPVRLTAVDAHGPGLRGPTAIAALAVGTTALGAVAIGRLAIGRAAIKRSRSVSSRSTSAGRRSRGRERTTSSASDRW